MIRSLVTALLLAAILAIVVVGFLKHFGVLA